jgi:hypothetical protein
VEPLARVSWLFVRGEEAIRVNYSAEELGIEVSGPGSKRRRFRFGDEETASEFLRLYEYSLSADGWVLQAFVERRGSGRAGSPAGGRERRRP